MSPSIVHDEKFQETQWLAPPRLSPAALDIWEKSQKNGWSVVVSKDTQKMQLWHYTVGLWDHYRHPELFLSGLPLKEGVFLLNHLSKKIKNGDALLTLEQMNNALEHIQQSSTSMPIVCTQLYSIPPALISTYLKMVGVFNPFWQTEALEIVHEPLFHIPSESLSGQEAIDVQPDQLRLYKLLTPT